MARFLELQSREEEMLAQSAEEPETTAPEAQRRRSQLGLGTFLGTLALSAALCFSLGVVAGSRHYPASSPEAPVRASAGGGVDGLTELAGGSSWLFRDRPANRTRRAATAVPQEGHDAPGWPCKVGEHLFNSRCFMTCSLGTYGKFTERADDCTCCKSLPCTRLPGHFEEDCPKLARGKDGPAEPPKLKRCKMATEELFDGLCYARCADLTYGKYPLRTGMNTCSNHEFGGNWTMGIGPCSGFGIGGDACFPHIPLPEGMGHKVPIVGATGVPPLGPGKVPLPNLATGTIDTKRR